MWPSLYTPKGTLKYEKLNYRITRFSTLMDELVGQKFSGYVEVLAPHEHGLIILYNGKVYNSYYEGTEDLRLSGEEIIEHFIQTETKERDTIINVGELAPRVIVALSALESRDPAHRELETVFLDMNALFNTLARKHFTGTLRFYRIRNNTRLGNILLRLKKITADQLREAIRLQLSEEGALRLGDALVQSGAIGKQDLEDALDRQSNTRKGSDLELAIALFSEGAFLGGYRHSDKELIQDRQEVISWLGTSEILMDIIDGLLPTEIKIGHVLHPEQADREKPAAPVKPAPTPAPAKPREVKEPPRPRPGAPNASQAKPAETKESEPKEKSALDDHMIQELTKETFMLKADDLILDIHAYPEAPPMPDEDEPADKNLSWLDALVSGKDKEAPERQQAEKIQKDLERAASNIITTEDKEILKQTPWAREVEEGHKDDIPQIAMKPLAPPKKETPQAGQLPKPAEEESIEKLAEMIDKPVEHPGASAPKQPAPAEQQPAAPVQPETPAAEPATEPAGHFPEKYMGNLESPSFGTEEKREAAAVDIRELDEIAQLLQEHMGFLGTGLLAREKQHFNLTEATKVTAAQLKNINEHLYHSTVLIVGAKEAEKIMYEIEERIGG